MRYPILLVVSVVFVSQAADALNGPKITLRLAERGGTTCPAPQPCSTYPVNASIGHSYDVYVVASVPDTGLGGISFGIGYDEVPGSGVDIYSWILCANGESPVSGRYGAWPAARSGNRILWSSCPRTPWYEDDGIHGVAGAFYVYAYNQDMLTVIGNDVPLEYVSCGSTAFPIPEANAGCLMFFPDGQGLNGFNPCTETWPYIDPGPWTPTVLLHVEDTTSPSPCFTEIQSNSGIVTHMDAVNPDGSTEYFVYVLAGDMSFLDSKAFVAGVEWGIDYTPNTGPGVGLKVLEWQSCGIETPTPTWPAPGSGNAMVWDPDVHQCHGDRYNEHYEKFTTLGYFRVAAYGPSTFSIISHPGSGRVSVAHCLGGTRCGAYRPVHFDTEGYAIVPSRTGWVSFGSAGAGCNPMLGPCGLALNKSTTWGQMKIKYRK